jgi:hypothetical protein
MHIKIFIFLFLLIAPIQAQSATQALLTKYVVKAKVDYSGLKKNVTKLDAIINTYKTIKLSNKSQDYQKAFWINAYNICTLKLIIDHYPLKSIRDIPKSKSWDARRWDVNGKKYSLNDIEHKILRKMGDPRIHFAINCASFSCPDLSSQEFSYDAKKLNKQLDIAMHAFLTNQKKGAQFKVESSLFGFGSNKNTLYLSKIFSWFSSDFVEHSGSIEKYIRKHASGELAKKLKNASSIKIKYLDYDWSLNK